MKDGGPAFPALPAVYTAAGMERRSAQGMSLRDYAIIEFAKALISGPRVDASKTPYPEAVVNRAREYADAMLAEREKESKG